MLICIEKNCLKYCLISETYFKIEGNFFTVLPIFLLKIFKINIFITYIGFFIYYCFYNWSFFFRVKKIIRNSKSWNRYILKWKIKRKKIKEKTKNFWSHHDIWRFHFHFTLCYSKSIIQNKVQRNLFYIIDLS